MSKNSKYILILIVLGYFFFIFGNSVLSLTNPDEVFYTLTAKEMALHHSWMTPYMFGQPQFEKPIFLYWMMRLSFLIFGATNFSARLPAANFALLGILAVYLLGRLAFKNEKKAFISSLILASGGIYIGLARTVFTDMIFSIFILFSLAVFYWGYVEKRHKNLSLILFFIFMALAVLTKGPLGIIVPFLAVVAFLAVRKDLGYLSCGSFYLGVLLFILISFPWYVLMIKKYSQSFTGEFFYNDHIRRFREAEHLTNDTWYFYPFSLIGCMFPWSIFLVAALFYLCKNLKQLKLPHLFLICWIGVTFLIFQPAHSKLISYVFPAFPALALVTGDFIYNIAFNEDKIRQFKVLALITWSILTLVPIGIAAAVFKFSHYLSSPAPAYFLLALILSWLVLILNFILRRNNFRAVYFFAFLVPIFLLIVPFIKNDIEPYLSSRDACAYLMKNYPVENIIISSKFYVRGVRYYTGREVAVLAPYQKNFFSPHPIPYFDSDEKASELIKSQKLTYCVLRKNAVEDLERIAKNFGFKYTLLKIIGNEYLLKVETKESKK